MNNVRTTMRSTTSDIDERPAVRFEGLRSRSGPLSWSQRWSWDIVQELVPNEQRIDFAMTLPTRVDLELHGVIAAFTDLISRYETLRTTYAIADDGQPWQTVRGEGVLRLDVFRADGRATGDVMAEAHASTVEGRFDLANELPLRVGVVTQGDHVVSVTVVLSNMTLDGWSVGLFRQELYRRIGPPTTTTPDPDPESNGPQPLDQVELERSPRGQRLAASGHSYWREQLEAVARLPEPSWRPVGDTPRFWCAGFTSVALARATHALAARWRVPASAVLLSALATMVGQRLGQPGVPVFLVSSNRHQPASRVAMAKYMQATPMVVDLAGVTFDELTRTTSARMLRASRFGQVDPVQVAPLANGPGPHRGAHLALPIVYDFHHQEGGVEEAGDVDAGQLCRAAVSSRFTWSNAIEQENLRLYLQVNAFGAEARLAMWTDTQYLSRIDVATIALGTERLLIEAVAGTTDVACLMRAIGVAVPGGR